MSDEMIDDVDFDEGFDAYSEDDSSCGIELEIGPREGRRTRRKVKARYGENVFTDELNPNDANARKKLVKSLSDRFDIEFSDEEKCELSDEIVRLADEADADKPATRTDGSAIRERELDQTPDEILDAARDLLYSPNLLQQVGHDLVTVGIAGESVLSESLYLIGTSRLNEKPLSGIVISPSASGKSHNVEKVSSLFPAESIYAATDITAQALYYLDTDELKHKFVVTGERRHGSDADGNANATLALRELMSAGKISKSVPVKSDHGMQTVRIELEGPIAFVQTTTQTEIFDEDRTRMLTLKTDDSPEQTNRVMEMHARQVAGKGVSTSEIERVRAVHHAAQRLLEPASVVIPYAEHILLAPDRIMSRRLFSQLLGCVSAVTLLHQFQRKDRDGELVATLEDYDHAYRVMRPAIRQICAPVSDGASRLHHLLLETHLPADRFDRLACQSLAGISATCAANYLNELIKVGMVKVAGDYKRGQKYEYMLMAPNHELSGVNGLISPGELRMKVNEAKQKSVKKRKPRKNPMQEMF